MWWGLVGHITSVADRFAEAGFVALAPDLYHGVIAKEPDHAMKMLMGLAMDKAALDIAGAAEYLSERDDVIGKGIGAVGFCMGRGLTCSVECNPLARDIRRRSVRACMGPNGYLL